MATITPQRRESQKPRSTSEGDHPFHVVLYNDDVHPFNAVVRQVQKATGVTEGQALAITLHAHRHGRAICFVGSLEACERVADILREIRLQVEVDRCP